MAKGLWKYRCSNHGSSKDQQPNAASRKTEDRQKLRKMNRMEFDFVSTEIHKHEKLSFIWNFCVKAGDLTISSSVWATCHLASRHLHCGTTPCVVSTRDQSQMGLQSACSVPQNTCITDHTCVVFPHLQCTSSIPAYRYLIVQFPIANMVASFCELEVYVCCELLYWLIEQGLTSHQTHYRSYRGRFLQVIWPNQQCQSTEGKQLVLQIRLESHQDHSTMLQ